MFYVGYCSFPSGCSETMPRLVSKGQARVYAHLYPAEPRALIGPGRDGQVADVIDWVTSVLPGCAAAEDGDEGLGLGGGKKLLVFAHHRDVMDRLQEGLEGALGRHM